MGNRGFYSRAMGVVIVATLGFLVYRVLETFFVPIAWSVLFAFMLFPVQARLVPRLKGKEALSAAIITFAMTVVLLGPVSIFATIFGRQAADVVTRFQSTHADVKEVTDVLNMPMFVGPMQNFEEWTGVKPEQARKWLTQGLRNGVEFLAGIGSNVVVGALGFIGKFAITLFILFFLLRDGRGMATRLVRLIPMPEARKVLLVRDLTSVTRAVVLGTLLTSALQGTAVALGFLFAGLPSVVFFGVLAALVSLVPLVGTALVWVPGALWLFSQDHNGAAAFLLVWGVLVVSSIDNFVKPLIISGQASVPTLLVFLGVLGGLSGFGVVGLFWGPVLLSVCVGLLRFADDVQSGEHDKEKGAPPVSVEPLPAVVASPAPASPEPAAPVST